MLFLWSLWNALDSDHFELKGWNVDHIYFSQFVNNKKKIWKLLDQFISYNNVKWVFRKGVESQRNGASTGRVQHQPGYFVETSFYKNVLMWLGVIIFFRSPSRIKGEEDTNGKFVSLPCPSCKFVSLPAPDDNLCPTIITCHVSNVSPGPPHVSKYPDYLPTICNYQYMGYRVCNNLILCIPEKGYGKEFSKLVFS